MESALLAAICAQPEDISARLVFADYLLEQPDPEKRDRGEFILAQCRGDGGGSPQSGGWPLGMFRSREEELLAKYREAWLAPLAGLVTHAAFHRGFPERVSMDERKFPGGFAELSRLTPVARLRVGLSGFLVEDAGELAEWEGVVGLDMSQMFATNDNLRALLEFPHLTRLNYLNLADNPLGDAGAEVLAASPVLRGLQFLGVARCGITPAGVSRLVSRIGTGAPGLRWLNLRGNPLSPGKWAENVLSHLPTKMSPALRLSLEAQLGRFRLTKPPPDAGPLPRLKAAKLSPEFTAWVKALDVSQPAQLVAALRRNALPAAVQTAFVAVCGRRCEFSVRRDGPGERVPVLPPTAGPGELADFVQQVMAFTVNARKPGGHVPYTAVRVPKRRPDIALWLRDWLLRLFEHHAAGTLDPEGRTR